MNIIVYFLNLENRYDDFLAAKGIFGVGNREYKYPPADIAQVCRAKLARHRPTGLTNHNR